MADVYHQCKVTNKHTGKGNGCGKFVSESQIKVVTSGPGKGNGMCPECANKPSAPETKPFKNQNS